MNWTQNKSIALSKVCVFVFAILGILLNIYIHHDIKFIILMRIYIPLSKEELIGKFSYLSSYVIYISLKYL